MEAVLVEYWDELTDPLVNPKKRVFFGYLLAALGIALVVLVIRARAGGGGFGAAFRALFARAIWWSASARADYKMIALNRALMMMISPALISQLALATLLFEALHGAFGTRPSLWPGASAGMIAGCFTVTHFLADDLSKYAVHRILHRWGFLWPFHKVHHTAETLTPLTVYRTHPFEGVVFALRSSAVQACTIAGFVFFFGDRADLVTILGANVFLFAFNAAGSNLRHSHVRISYGRVLERIFISPAQHQIHHSIERRHHDKNFGAVLAIWDWMGGTLCLSNAREPLRFGVSAHAEPANHALKTLYLTPVAEAMSVVGDRLTKGTEFMWLSRLALPPRPDTTRAVALRRTTLALLLCVSLLPLSGGGARADNELNIYSHRQPFLIEPFVEAYTRQTGVEVNIVYASRGLVQRLQAEGENSPADVVLTVDIGRLAIYADKNLLAPVQSEVLAGNIPQHLRDPSDRWFGLSKRARVVAVAKDRVAPDAIRRIEDLADPRWEGRICTRPGSHVYNRALVASMIAAHGEAAAEEWARGLVANLARRPQGNDRAQIKAIFEGVCDIAVINSYYYAKLRYSDIPEQREWAAAIDVVFTNQDDRGNHINISGAGVAVHSKRKEAAIAFLEFLTQQTAQELYAEVNYEYPVNLSVTPSTDIPGWGKFKEDELPIARIAELAPLAQRIIDRVGW